MLTVVSAANFYKWNSGFWPMHHVGAPDIVCLEEMTHLGAYLHQPVRDGFSPLVAVFDKFHFLLCIASSLVVRRFLFGCPSDTISLRFLLSSDFLQGLISPRDCLACVSIFYMFCVIHCF